MFTVTRLGIDGRLAQTLTTSDPDRIDDLDRQNHQPQRHPLARRADRAALDRRRHLQRRTILPPHQGLRADARFVDALRRHARPEPPDADLVGATT